MILVRVLLRTLITMSHMQKIADRYLVVLHFEGVLYVVLKLRLEFGKRCTLQREMF